MKVWMSESIHRNEIDKILVVIIKHLLEVTQNNLMKGFSWNKMDETVLLVYEMTSLIWKYFCQELHSSSSWLNTVEVKKVDDKVSSNFILAHSAGCWYSG